jgi:hypothetical protein
VTEAPYVDARAVEMAIKAAAASAQRADSSVSVSDRIRQAYFDRLLCRVFSQGPSSEWVLKGGTGMLARVPNARATMDIDLFINGYTLEQALLSLRTLASLDLSDHFRFEYLKHTESLAGDQQPYANGYRVTFQVFLGTRRLSDVSVDLVAGAGDLSRVETADPANRVAMPRLITYPYRLYPVERQVADKVCATLATYPSGASSRERDLVDLVVIANTQSIPGIELREAIRSEARLRDLGHVTGFTIPSGWGRAYERTASSIPACSRHQAIDDARALMTDFITRILESDDLPGMWNPESLTWT